MILENDVERYLIHEIGQRGGLTIKLGQDGWPDRLVLLPGQPPIFVELKRTGGRLSHIQRWRIDKLRKLGQRVEVPYTKADVDDILRG